MPFSPSAQYAKNVGTVLQCEECSKWRLFYSKASLKKDQKLELERLLDNFSYVCGNLLLDIECDEESVLNSVFVKANLACSNPIEIPYYSSGKDPICYFCGTEDDIVQKTDFLPGCTACCTSGNVNIINLSLD